MSNAYLSPILNDAQFNDDGTFLAGGLIWFYQAGTSTPILAYTGPDAATAWTNPIVLDQRGETGGEIWLAANNAYKMVVETPPEYGQAHGVVVSNFDNISGVNDPGTSTIQNWVAFAGTPTYTSATTFTVTGDQRTIFLKSRRLKTSNTAGTVYSTIVSSSYASGLTTVTVSNDYGQSLDGGLSAVFYGFIETGPVSSIPVPVNAGSAAGGSQYQMWMNYDGSKIYWSADNAVSNATWPISILAPSGSATAPSIAFSGESLNTTGFFHPATGQISVACSGTDVADFTTGGMNVIGVLRQNNKNVALQSNFNAAPITVSGLTGTSYSGTVIFPTAFPTSCTACVTSLNNQTGGTVTTTTIFVNSTTSTGFSYQLYFTSGTTQIEFSYIAIGV